MAKSSLLVISLLCFYIAPVQGVMAIISSAGMVQPDIATTPSDSPVNKSPDSSSGNSEAPILVVTPPSAYRMTRLIDDYLTSSNPSSALTPDQTTGLHYLQQYLIFRLSESYGMPKGFVNPEFYNEKHKRTLNELEYYLAQFPYSYHPMFFSTLILDAIATLYPGVINDWNPLLLLERAFPNSIDHVARRVPEINHTGSLFHMAIYSGFASLVEKYLKASPLLVNQPDPKSGLIPVTIAICRDVTEVQKVLKTYGINIPSHPEKTYSIREAWFASMYGRGNFFTRWVIEHPNEINTFDFNLLGGAILGENVKAVKLLLKCGAKPNFEIATDTTPFVIAIKKTYSLRTNGEESVKMSQIVRKLMKAGGNLFDLRIAVKLAGPLFRSIIRKHFKSYCRRFGVQCT